MVSEVTPARLEQWATEDYAAAQFALFKCYRNGLGVTKDLEKAADYLYQAASNGHTRAMWLLAYAYQFGRWSFPQNHTLSFEWYERLTAEWKRQAARGESDARTTLEVLRKFAKQSGQGNNRP